MTLGRARRRGRLGLELIDPLDALALPSHLESFGAIALRAMAGGRPVAVSSARGILGWTPLSPGRFTMRDGEHLSATLARLGKLDPAFREHKARIARQAAAALDRENPGRWIRVLRGHFEPPADVRG